MRRQRAPVAMGMSTVATNPQMQGMGDGNTRVRHREFIGNVGAEYGFDTQLFSTGINPGDGKTFPWLSQLAKGYERYRVNSMRFHYEPFTATTKEGTISMFVDYDPSDVGPQTKSELLNSYRSVRSSIWMPTSTTLSQKELSVDDHLFVRTQQRAIITENLKLYDVGTLFCAFTDTSDTTTLHGELWVSYDITLMIPSFHKTVVNTAEVNRLDVTNGSYLGRVDPGSRYVDDGSSLNFSTHQIDENAYIEFHEPFTGVVNVQLEGGPGADMFQVEPTLDPAAPISRLAKLGHTVSHYITSIDSWLHTVEVIAEAGERLAFRLVEMGGSSWTGYLDMNFTEYAPALFGALLALRSDEPELTARLQSNHLKSQLTVPMDWSVWRAKYAPRPYQITT